MLSTTILSILALAFALMGIGALVSPTIVTRQFGVPALTVEGRSEVRAVYGGFGLAIAGALIYAVIDANLREGIALTVAIALFGMAAGRLISAAIDRSMRKVAAGYLVIEGAGGGLLLLAR